MLKCHWYFMVKRTLQTLEIHILPNKHHLLEELATACLLHSHRGEQTWQWFTCMCQFPSEAHMLLSLWMIRELGRVNPRTFPLYLRRKGVCLGPECWKFHWQMFPSSLECLCPVFRICSHQRAPEWPVHEGISVLRPETLSKVLRPHWSSAAAMSCFVPLAASL